MSESIRPCHLLVAGGFLYFSPLHSFLLWMAVCTLHLLWVRGGAR